MKQGSVFLAELTVRVSDLNYGGHLANDRVLTYFHEARVRWLNSIGLSEADIGERVSLTQTEVFVQYKGEAFLGERLRCAVRPESCGGVRFRLSYELTRPSDCRMIALGYVDLAGFDYRAHRLKRLPDSFRKILLSFWGQGGRQEAAP